jgi:hypothetical protein
MRSQAIPSRAGTARTRSTLRGTVNAQTIRRKIVRAQPDTLEELMSKLLGLIEQHPEWYQQEHEERMGNIFRELLRL